MIYFIMIKMFVFREVKAAYECIREHSGSCPSEGETVIASLDLDGYLNRLNCDVCTESKETCDLGMFRQLMYDFHLNVQNGSITQDAVCM